LYQKISIYSAEFPGVKKRKRQGRKERRKEGRKDGRREGRIEKKDIMPEGIFLIA
jgi:flagellar biosynthesis/type III secretory pathway protein FliH